MKKYICLLLICICFQILGVRAQSIPEVGRPCPDFQLPYVTHFPKKQVTLNDFKGKWLFLDFWFTGCASCIESFPKINALQKEFEGKAQFLLVGVNDKKNGRNIETVFEKLRASKGLNVASAYDSVLVRTWGVQSMPHIVIIDPKGIVRYITDGVGMTKERVRGIVEGQEIALAEKDKALPSFVNTLSKADGKPFPKDKILHHSVLTNWNGEEGFSGFEIESFSKFSDKKDGLTYAKMSLEWLYSSAYLGKASGYLKFWGDASYGKIYPFPVYELKDNSTFVYDYNDNSRGFYNYNLNISPEKATKENLMKYMQQDLERVFGYYGAVEEREMPVWKLVAKPGAEAKIKTKGGPRYYSAAEGYSIVAGFSVRNVPLKDYLTYLCFYLNNTEKHPFIDATEISNNIDLTIDADLTSLDDVKKALQKKGLDLVLGTKKMPVLVIRDLSTVTSSK